MYHWKIDNDHGDCEGYAGTLSAACEQLAKYAGGKQVRDFHINGHHMNQEFDLWISGGKIVHDGGEEFVPSNEWYERLGGRAAATESDVLGEVMTQIVNAFRPQPTRGSAPTNPATLAAKGEL